ncbi:MAG: tetraacyldisaccharide 4'-kinase, partial [Ferruginibacter sp.]|nr:tetraacyldisaccharide 4'-kinase [Cytophagales bacterium]
LLDDAYQHRSVRPHLNLLLTDYGRPFTRDWPFPAGRLRERRHGARRADAVIVTKCPEELAGEERLRLEEDIRRYLRPGTPVFFSAIRYGEPCPFFSEQTAPLTGDVLLVSGIAQPAPFEQYATRHYRVVEHCRFGDHHRYSEKDWQRIGLALQRAKERSPREVAVLTTEKDFVKLASPAFEDWTRKLVCFYLPIEVYFPPNQGTKFEEWVLKAAAGHAIPSESGSGPDHRSFFP